MMKTSARSCLTDMMERCRVLDSTFSPTFPVQQGPQGISPPPNVPKGAYKTKTRSRPERLMPVHAYNVTYDSPQGCKRATQSTPEQEAARRSRGPMIDFPCSYGVYMYLAVQTLNMQNWNKKRVRP